MARLIVVSNRVAVPKSGTHAGGLAIALRAALRRNPGIWFGWSGRATAKGGETRTVEQDGITYVVTDLPREDYQEYYNGFANRVLWPILHYRLDLAEFSRRDLSGYLRVNERFADELHKLLRPDDIVWVHDYHFLALARALRERGHSNKIGFFLHIPFPPSEIVTALPQHERIVLALCHYDLVGFQTVTDATNFARYLESETAFPGDAEDGFDTGERRVRVGAFPVGVETEAFSRLAQRSAESGFVASVTASLSGRAMIIGVDRLDYSKGIEQRMDAFERFLAEHPEWRNNVTFLQITPKSRSDIREYTAMDQLVSAKVGQVNGAYGEANWTPIRYVNRTHSQAQLAGLYRKARAALVTPLRDGMNLVAKEFVAAQDDDDPGVLILSRFAGAAVECRPALLVNPYDTDSVALAINRAMSMPLEERRARQRAMRQTLLANDIGQWPGKFLGALTGRARIMPPVPAGGLRDAGPVSAVARQMRSRP
ncbi:MAG: alpha,alpha-trehalose-phosphate synthase (UDP-forming) [Pseudorhodoplanes sp.]|nr:Trehalose-6-phosphate synthase [Pseudorhodoplanes sp.]MBW7948118.1 alpha,alpha-trehalose-phosphate synthase (UDP-forming) [Pseudorhodoplanes sp.]MCL4711827.1 alpha,alpha-trehalose-phosphate synthase (UDP-forming) [Pseudorhodoplanes sp.]MCQ3942670.1 alpha,alpha-trehalose-phosphate synthase (UDP-forming) [Alphaproteobacteria bacterium]GIK81065.1 MAG: alpha,alpha-trehalose-phosphate synthase (UDP-forming) [Alphaproteobacteria bacterium]